MLLGGTIAGWKSQGQDPQELRGVLLQKGRRWRFRVFWVYGHKWSWIHMEVSNKSWGYPQVTNFRIFHYKPTIVGYPIYGNLHISVRCTLRSGSKVRSCHSRRPLSYDRYTVTILISITVFHTIRAFLCPLMNIWLYSFFFPYFCSIAVFHIVFPCIYIYTYFLDLSLSLRYFEIQSVSNTCSFIFPYKIVYCILIHLG